jgi:hypothetical protein
MDTSSTPTCPECGFRIYNRRYPNCESCGAALPETLVYSPAERFALQHEEEERALERARQSSEEEFSITTPGSLDDAVLTAAMGLTSR